MKFVQNFTPPDFQVKNFTPSISPNFNSFSKKKHKKLVKMEKFTPLATNFTLPPGLTGWTNFTSADSMPMLTLKLVLSSGQIENSKQQKFQLICVTRYLVFTLAVVSPKGIESQRNNGSQVVSDHVHVLLPWTSVDGQPRLNGRTKRGEVGELPKNAV